jgi:hypothetical protein
MNCDHAKALQAAKNGDWDQAHELVQDYRDSMSCLIHGYLHRVEGDLSNAGYWYNRAGQSMPDNTLEDELNRILDLAAEH